MNLTDEQFEEQVLNNSNLVLVDFWAPWCGPCKGLSPTIDEIAKEYSGRLDVFKMDVDTCVNTAQRYYVRSVPTLMYFKDGRVVGSTMGNQSKGKITGTIDTLLKDLS